MAVTKKRLDVLLVERGMVETRAKAQGVIMAGEVLVNGTMIDKPGAHYAEEVELTLKARPQYVSRGGEKLAGALRDFQFNPAGHIAADVGASTGGFTDCLLQQGAARVYAIDVGYGQLAHKLRTDARVVVMERTNARYIELLPEPITLAVIDASFISLRLILPAVRKWLAPQADIIALIKPQFEAGRDDIGKGGVVRRREVHERVIREVLTHAQENEFTIAGLTVSALKGPAGNTEFLVWLHSGQLAGTLDIDALLVSLLPLD